MVMTVNEYENDFYRYYESLKDSFKRFGKPSYNSLGKNSSSSSNGMIHELSYKIEYIHHLKEVYNRTELELWKLDEFRDEIHEKHLENNFYALWHMLQAILHFYATNELEYGLKDLILQEKWEITIEFVKKQYILYLQRKTDFENKQRLRREQEERMRNQNISNKQQPVKIEFDSIPDCCIVCKHLMMPDEYDGDNFGCSLEMKEAMKNHYLVWNPLTIKCNGFVRIRDEYYFYKGD